MRASCAALAAPTAAARLPPRRRGRQPARASGPTALPPRRTIRRASLRDMPRTRSWVSRDAPSKARYRPSSIAATAIAAFSRYPSTASSSASVSPRSAATAASSARREEASRALTHCSRTLTAQSGLISATRCSSSRAFERPTVEARAWICRFVLLMHSSSRSTRTSAPTPERASASTAHDPTPPRPTTTTREDLSRSGAASPYNLRTPSKRSA
mmetsp:Transcript_10716/g.33875  ORF Transcript_10716/g.33875 Transcript_10716/m.33875 type:complete len:214 (+) Transcript_10716:985-1626(+)